MRGVGEFAGGERAAVQQRTQDVGAGGVADESRDCGKVKDFTHERNIACRGSNRTGSRQPMFRPRPKRLVVTSRSAGRLSRTITRDRVHTVVVKGDRGWMR